MVASPESEGRVVAPAELSIEARTAFRQTAIAVLEELPERQARLTIDLSSTKRVDSAGLGALMLVQRKAAERGQTVVLSGASDEIRFLLTLTRLDDLFSFESG